MNIKSISMLTFLFLVVGCSHGGRHHKMMHKMGMKHWEMMDTNKDGKVSKKEFNTSHKAKFKQFDANKDGFITAEENKIGMKAMMKNCCKDKKGKHDCKDGQCDLNHHHKCKKGDGCDGSCMDKSGKCKHGKECKNKSCPVHGKRKK